MRLLVLTGKLYPVPGNNANLLAKLLPHLAAVHEVRILSTAIHSDSKELPPVFQGLPVYWIYQNSIPQLERKLLFPALAKVFDANGNSDYLTMLYAKKALHHIMQDYHFDAVISTVEPYPASDISTATSATKILYIMDPPELLRNEAGTKYRNKNLCRILSSQDLILTTPFIKDAIQTHGMKGLASRIIQVGFPMVGTRALSSSTDNNGYIKLLFSGWMCSKIRSPKYFLDIVSRLDERFEVTFMGKECELLEKRFPIETKAKLITMPNQPYETALQAMADADILINIGNSVPVHMPSKTLEYINTGKPFVNFHKMDDCPTLYYTNRYPLCLNMFENDPDIDAAAERFIDFCIANKGKTVDREYIEREYEDCTPEYIAKMILTALETRQ